MKFNDIYVPVFEDCEKHEKVRQLRADFGSRKVDLVCTKCWHEFTKRIGPNTNSVACPECDNNRVKPALSELTKKKLIKMKECVDDGDMHGAVQESIEVIDTLHGKTDTKSIKMMNEALITLLSIERGLIPRKKELKLCIAEGVGRSRLAVIARKLGYELFKEEK